MTIWQGCRNFVFVEPISEETLEKILDLSREPKEDSGMSGLIYLCSS